MDPRPSEDFAAFVSARQSSARSTAAPEPALHAVEGGLSTATSSPRGPWSRLVEAAIDAGAGVAYRLIRHPPDLLLKRLGVATPRRRTDFDTLARIVRTMDAIPGAVLECGTHYGATLLGMAHILRGRGTPARLYGLDSFEGLPEPSPEDAFEDGTMHPWVRKGALNEASFEELAARIRRMGLSDRITVIKGFFEDTLPALASERFSLVHVDCDLYDSYISCLEFAYPRMLPCGYMVFDDYGSPVYVGAQRAVDEFLAGKPERIQFFPDSAGRRYFVLMGGGLAPGAQDATTAPPQAERQAA